MRQFKFLDDNVSIMDDRNRYDTYVDHMVRGLIASNREWRGYESHFTDDNGYISHLKVIGGIFTYLRNFPNVNDNTPEMLHLMYHVQNFEFTGPNHTNVYQLSIVLNNEEI